MKFGISSLGSLSPEQFEAVRRVGSYECVSTESGEVQNARRVLCEWENFYANSRSADSEQPLVRTSGIRPGDTTVQYDKGGWVVVMSMEMMDSDAMLVDLKDFIAT